jgi:hypothetical protein
MRLTRILAATGTALVWFPIAFMVALSASRFLAGRVLRLDWLMPAELFPIALAGGGALLVAALRAGSRRRLLGVALAAAVCCLAASQGLAVTSGLASGDSEPAGWAWTLVLAGIAAYTAAVIAMGAGGLLLLRDLLKQSSAHLLPRP